MNRKSEILLQQLNESHRSLSTQLKEVSYLNYTKLESSVYKIVEDKEPLNEKEKSSVTLNYLFENNHVSIEQYETLKTILDSIVANKQHTYANKQQTYEAANIAAQTSVVVKQIPMNEDNSEEQELLKQYLNLLGECNESPEKFRELETLVGALAESSVSRDYIDATLKDQAVKRLNDLQEITASIQDITTTNSALERRNTELQACIEEMKKKKRPTTSLMDEEIKKQQIIIKTMHDENNLFKTKFEKMMTEKTENILCIIQMLTEKIP